MAGGERKILTPLRWFSTLDGQLFQLKAPLGDFRDSWVPQGAGGLTLVPQLGKGFLLSTCFPLQPLRTGKSSREVPLPLQEAGQDLRRPQRRPWANSTAGIWSEETFLRPVL